MLPPRLTFTPKSSSSVPITLPYFVASPTSQLAALASEDGSAVAGPTPLPTPTLPSARYSAGIPSRVFAGTHPAAPSGTVYPYVWLVVTPPCTMASFSVCVICATSASASESGSPAPLGGGGLLLVCALPPHPISAAAINASANPALARRAMIFLNCRPESPTPGRIPLCCNISEKRIGFPLRAAHIAPSANTQVSHRRQHMARILRRRRCIPRYPPQHFAEDLPPGGADRVFDRGASPIKPAPARPRSYPFRVFVASNRCGRSEGQRSRTIFAVRCEGTNVSTSGKPKDSGCR
jgi:hypothetical protein